MRTSAGFGQDKVTVRLRRTTGETGQLREFCVQVLPEGNYQTVFIKPNWVKHREDPAFPIGALVTSTALIEAAIQACLTRYPEVREIVVGDAPLKSCEWDLLMSQTGTDRLMAKYGGFERPGIGFQDLRRETYGPGTWQQTNRKHCNHGDPKGYREVVLDETSFLDPISDNREKFRVADYSSEKT